MQVMQDLITRIQTGMTTADDARAVAAIVARLEQYEATLREIAASGRGTNAVRAFNALAGQGQHLEGGDE